jgi:signal transduction histidine kinase
MLAAREFRLALAFALAIAAVIAGVFVVIYLDVAREDTNRIGAILVEESRRNVEASEDNLRQALEARQAADIRRIDYVALFDERGVLRFGDVVRLPDVPVDGRAHLLAAKDWTTDLSAGSSVFVLRRRADGGVLLLGRDLRETYDVENALLRAFAIALAPTIALTLAIGAIFAARARRRLLRLHDAIRRIIEGDLALRLPALESGDEIDGVARAVNLMLDEIARLLSQLKSVGDNIAHDLRAPLAVAKAKLERLLEEEPNGSPMRKELSSALNQLEKAAVTIAALLRISGVENAPRESRFNDIDLAAICAEIAEFFEPLAESKSIALTADLPEPVWTRGDATLMREAVSNLVDNAIKFTPVGGRVRIEASAAGGRAVVQVSDSGCGVPAHERENIFRRFYRAPSGAGVEGHGLGLNIAQTIAHLHGFEVVVEDNDPGARFVIRALARSALAKSRSGAERSSILG